MSSFFLFICDIGLGPTYFRVLFVASWQLLHINKKTNAFNRLNWLTNGLNWEIQADNANGAYSELMLDETEF